MTAPRPFAEPLARLRTAGLRPTRQRMALARLLFEKGDRHVSADELHAEAQRADIPVSLATIYNTLNQFTAAGLMREVVVEPGKSYFDTNVTPHHHFYVEDHMRLFDIPATALQVAGVPDPPSGLEVARVDVIIRLRRSK